MRFLVDESTGKKFADLLKRKHDVVFVGDVMPTATDEKVISYAEKENRILVTDDKDFGELVFRLQKPSKGVILLRIDKTSPDYRFEILNNVLETQKIKNRFIVVKEEKIRIRKI